MTQKYHLQNIDKLTRRRFLGLTGLCAAGLAVSCMPVALPPATRSLAYFPTDTWRTSTPEEQGIDSQGIANMLEDISRSSPYVHSFLLIRNGTLVTEAYFAPIVKDHVHFLFSATKSVTSALVGIAIQDKYIKSVDQKILDFFPEMKAKNPGEHLAMLTIEHLLTMSTGHVDYMSPNPYQSPPVDWVEKFLADKTNTLVDPQGINFLYTSGAAHTLSALIQRTTGKSTADYAAEKLFGPLGIHDFAWLPDQNGINFGNSWLRLKPLDMAKFGYLYLNNGIWNDQQVIPRGWIEKSTQKHIETKGTMFNTAEQDGYGYLWWMNGFGGFSAHGYGGQFIFVIPESNLVAVFTGGFDDPLFDASYQRMKKYILPAIKPGASIAKNDRAYQALASLINQAGHQTQKIVPPLPSTAGQISGKAYQFSDGTRFTVYFNDSDEYTLKVIYPPNNNPNATTVEIQGGLDNIYRLNKSSDLVYGPCVVAVKGYWSDESTFVHIEYPTDNVSSRIITCHYKNDRLAIEIKDDFSGKSTFSTNLEATLVN